MELLEWELNNQNACDRGEYILELFKDGVSSNSLSKFFCHNACDYCIVTDFSDSEEQNTLFTGLDLQFLMFLQVGYKNNVDYGK
jgi:hypothetical protein